MKRMATNVPQTPEEFAAEMRAYGVGMGFAKDAAREVLQDQIIPLTAANVSDNYDRGQDAAGNAWPPHAPATVAKYGPHPLLILSGAMLRASIDGAGHIERIEETDGGVELQFGLTKDVVVYAGVQQFGWQEKNIPPRPYMCVSDQTIDKGTQQIADALMEALA